MELVWNCGIPPKTPILFYSIPGRNTLTCIQYTFTPQSAKFQNHSNSDISIPMPCLARAVEQLAGRLAQQAKVSSRGQSTTDRQRQREGLKRWRNRFKPGELSESHIVQRLSSKRVRQIEIRVRYLSRKWLQVESRWNSLWRLASTYSVQWRLFIWNI